MKCKKLHHEIFRTALAFFFNFCGDKSPFCGATGALCFGLWLTLHMGYKAKARVDPSSVALCSHLCVMILRVNSEFPGLGLSQFYTLVW